MAPTEFLTTFTHLNHPMTILPLLADALPAIDGPYVVALVSRVLHILCALILGGGLFYLRTILAPSGPDACYGTRRAIWAKWVGMATGLLLASGIYNFMVIVAKSKQPGATPLPPAYHMLFGAKFLLGLFVMFVAAILAGKTAAADRFRANANRWWNLSKCIGFCSGDIIQSDTYTGWARNWWGCSCRDTNRGECWWQASWRRRQQNGR